MRASETDAFAYDATCRAHFVTKRDKDGNVISFRYSDHGNLHAGQTAPDRAVRFATIGYVIYGLPCSGFETVSPSGRTSSTLTCR